MADADRDDPHAGSRSEVNDAGLHHTTRTARAVGRHGEMARTGVRTEHFPHGRHPAAIGRTANDPHAGRRGISEPSSSPSACRLTSAATPGLPNRTMGMRKFSCQSA